MSFFASLPSDAGPPNVFVQYPEIYSAWSKMSEALMNGPSPLSHGERELILAYAAGVAGCTFVYVAHSEVAYAWGIPEGLVRYSTGIEDVSDLIADLEYALAAVS